MHISVICTVLNEGDSLRPLLDSLRAQTRPPDEIVVVDGGSTDGTVAILHEYKACLPLRIIVAPGANISAGRNMAIQAAAGPLIASTDAGVRLAPAWLAELSQPFEQADPPRVVSGFFVPDPHTPFEVAMGATVLPTVSDINPDTFLPSSRSVAFRKADWASIGGYPEWLDYCEDLIFDFRLREQAGPFAFAPRAIAYFRPRGSLRAFFKQYYQYARGDGKADLFRRRHFIRYTTYLLALPLLLILGWLVSPWVWLGLALLGGLGLFYRPYRRLIQQWGQLTALDKVKTLAYVPLIRLTGDLAKMIGYPVGLRWRWQRLAHQPHLHWR